MLEVTPRDLQQTRTQNPVSRHWLRDSYPDRSPLEGRVAMTLLPQVSLHRHIPRGTTVSQNLRVADGRQLAIDAEEKTAQQPGTTLG